MRLVTVPFLVLGAQLVTAALPLLPGQIKNLVVFGDSYSVQNVGGGRIQWVDWLVSKDYANLNLYDFAKSGATCSQALTPRIYPGIVEDELPEFLGKQRNGTVPRLSGSSTLYAIWIGTNDLGPGCLLTGEQTRGVSIVDTTSCVGNLVRQLYKNGGRNFVVLNASTLVRSSELSLTLFPDSCPGPRSDVPNDRIPDQVLLRKYQRHGVERPHANPDKGRKLSFAVSSPRPRRRTSVG